MTVGIVRTLPEGGVAFLTGNYPSLVIFPTSAGRLSYL